MERLLIGLELFQSAGWILTLIALRRMLRVNAAQAQELARLRKWDEALFSARPEGVPLEINRIKPFGLDPMHFEDRN